MTLQFVNYFLIPETNTPDHQHQYHQHARFQTLLRNELLHLLNFVMNAFKFLFSFLIFSTKVSYFSCVIRSIISYEIRNLWKRQKKKRISVALHTEHWQRACSHAHTQSVNGWYAFEISLPYSAKQLALK